MDFKEELNAPLFLIVHCGQGLLLYLAFPFISAALPETEERSVHLPVNICVTRLSLHVTYLGAGIPLSPR